VIVVKSQQFVQRKVWEGLVTVLKVANTSRVVTCASKLQCSGRGNMLVRTIGLKENVHMGASETGSGKSNAMTRDLMEVSKANGQCASRFVVMQSGWEPSGRRVV